MLTVPADWKSVSLEQLCSIKIGGTPSRSNPDYWVVKGETGHLWASISDLRQGVVNNTKEKITSLGVAKSNVKMIPKGTILMSFKLTVGRIAIAGEDLFTNEAIAAFEPLDERLSKDYLKYALPGSVEFGEVDQAVKGKTLNKSKLQRLPVTLPPLAEQERIAEVLTSVDDAIRATQAVIEQTHTVKKGLLQTLLTQGLGHTKFKNSQLGEIPESWNVVRLESLLADVDTPMRSGPFGSALKKSELVADGIPFLGIDNVHVENFIARYKRFVTPEKARELKRYAVRASDVMITIMGTVGRCCVVPDRAEGALSSKHIWTMTFDQSRYIPELICWQLNYAPWVLQEFSRSAQGGIMSAINSKVLKGLLLPCPPIEEQRHIANMLDAQTRFIKTNEQKLTQLQTLKSGLMSDLLTGRVRTVKGAA